MDTTLAFFIFLHLTVPGLLFANLTWDLQQTILPCIALSFFSFFLAYRIIPSVAEMTKKAGMSGKDLNKKDGKEMYVYLLIIVFIARNTETIK